MASYNGTFEMEGARVTRTPYGFRALHESSAKMCLKIRSYPLPVITWFKDGVQLHEDERHKFYADDKGLFSISIDPVLVNDTGRYTCVATNEYGQAKESAFFRVVKVEKPPSPPKFSTKLKDTAVSEGGSGTFECEVEGWPEPEIRFFVDGHAIHPSHVYHIEYDGHTATLKIRDVQSEDAGLYAICLTNDMGETYCQARLNVEKDPHKRKVAPEFQQVMEDKVVDEGDTAEFKVLCTGDPEPVVTWCVNRHLLTPSENVNIIAEDEVHMLIIRNVSMNFDGKVTCSAMNRQGYTRCTGQLTVRSNQEFVGKTRPQITAMKIGSSIAGLKTKSLIPGRNLSISVPSETTIREIKARLHVLYAIRRLDQMKIVRRRNVEHRQELDVLDDKATVAGCGLSAEDCLTFFPSMQSGVAEVEQKFRLNGESAEVHEAIDRMCEQSKAGLTQVSLVLTTAREPSESSEVSSEETTFPLEEPPVEPKKNDTPSRSTDKTLEEMIGEEKRSAAIPAQQMQQTADAKPVDGQQHGGIEPIGNGQVQHHQLIKQQPQQPVQAPQQFPSSITMSATPPATGGTMMAPTPLAQQHQVQHQQGPPPEAGVFAQPPPAQQPYGNQPPPAQQPYPNQPPAGVHQGYPQQYPLSQGQQYQSGAPPASFQYGQPPAGVQQPMQPPPPPIQSQPQQQTPQPQGQYGAYGGQAPYGGPQQMGSYPQAMPQEGGFGMQPQAGPQGEMQMPMGPPQSLPPAAGGQQPPAQPVSAAGGPPQSQQPPPPNASVPQQQQSMPPPEP